MTLWKPARSLMAVVAVMVLASATAFAKESTTLKLIIPAVLQGKQLEAGSYKLAWEASSSQASVTLSKKKEIVATAKGKLKEAAIKYLRNMIVLDRQPDGSQTITEICIGGTNQAIVFTD